MTGRPSLASRVVESLSAIFFSSPELSTRSNEHTDEGFSAALCPGSAQVECEGELQGSGSVLEVDSKKNGEVVPVEGGSFRQPSLENDVEVVKEYLSGVTKCEPSGAALRAEYKKGSPKPALSTRALLRSATTCSTTPGASSSSLGSVVEAGFQRGIIGTSGAFLNGSAPPGGSKQSIGSGFSLSCLGGSPRKARRISGVENTPIEHANTQQGNSPLRPTSVINSGQLTNWSPTPININPPPTSTSTNTAVVKTSPAPTLLQSLTSANSTTARTSQQSLQVFRAEAGSPPALSCSSSFSELVSSVESTTGSEMKKSGSSDIKKETSTGSLASGSTQSGSKKCRWIRDVSKEYRILDEVMPSTHRGQAVHFATRLRDGLKVVVKIREKLVSFKDANDISTWKTAMENLLNWQDSFGEHIAGLYDLFEDTTAYYVTMELVNGLDLFEFIHHVKMTDDATKLLFLKKVAYECMRALCDYEALSLVHKDIKLENVVLMDTQKRGVLKVIDFDTVEEYGEDTRVYDVMGTDQYIAPESYYGYYTTASDIFALGVMLYKLCTGSFPFVDEIFDDEAGQNYVGHPKMRQIRGKLRLAKIDFTTHPFFHYDKQVKDFIKRCLVFDVHRRMTTKQAMEHPLVRNYEEEAFHLKWTDFRAKKH